MIMRLAGSRERLNSASFQGSHRHQACVRHGVLFENGASAAFDRDPKCLAGTVLSMHEHACVSSFQRRTLWLYSCPFVAVLTGVAVALVAVSLSTEQGVAAANSNATLCLSNSSSGFGWTGGSENGYKSSLIRTGAGCATSMVSFLLPLIFRQLVSFMRCHDCWSPVVEVTVRTVLFLGLVGGCGAYFGFGATNDVLLSVLVSVGCSLFGDYWTIVNMWRKQRWCRAYYADGMEQLLTKNWASSLVILATGPSFFIAQVVLTLCTVLAHIHTAWFVGVGAVLLCFVLHLLYMCLELYQWKVAASVRDATPTFRETGMFGIVLGMLQTPEKQFSSPPIGITDADI